MFCPSCHTKNPFFNKFCYNCGHKLKIQSQKDEILKPDNGMDDHGIMPIDKSSPTNENDLIDDKSSSIDEAHDEYSDHNYKQDEPKDFLDDPVSNSDNDVNELKEMARTEQTEDAFDFSYDFSNNDTYPFDLDDPFTYNPKQDQEFSSQMPLRRYQKDKNVKPKGKVLKTIFSLISIILGVLLIGFLIHRLGQGTSSINLSQSITVSSSVEELPSEDYRTYKIVFNTANGEEVQFLDDILEVTNGRAEFIIDESTLYLYNPQLRDDDTYEVNLDAIVTAPNLSNVTERVTIILSPPYNYAPFNLIKPSTSETEFEGSSSKVAFRVEPDSKVFINDKDLSGQVSQDGRFENEFTLTPSEELLILDIRVSTPGYLDNIQQIILRKTSMDVLLEIESPMPIVSNEEWIEIRGKTDPNASLEANLDIFEEPKIDSNTGEFSIYVKATYSGYTPCLLKAKLGDKESSLEVILEQNNGIDSYTSTAWEPEYSKLKDDDDLHNGQHFVLTGTIEEILETGDKSIFILGLQDDPENKPAYVEFWGSFEYEPGDRLRVFANRWEARDGIPRFLAKYIYD